MKFLYRMFGMLFLPGALFASEKKVEIGKKKVEISVLDQIKQTTKQINEKFNEIEKSQNNTLKGLDFLLKHFGIEKQSSDKEMQ